MNALNYALLGKRIGAQLEHLAPPTGPERLRGALESTCPDGKDTVFETFYQVYSEGWYNNPAIHNVHGKIELAASLLEMTSNLYAVGAPHATWRRWCALTALGWYLEGKRFEAAIYAAIAREWAFIEHLPVEPLAPTIKALRYLVPWKLLGMPANIPLEGRDEEDAAWLQLAHSIPARDYAATAHALAMIADWWIGETDGDCFEYHPGYELQFDPEVCAAAALARRSGFDATVFLEFDDAAIGLWDNFLRRRSGSETLMFSHEHYRYLEPGLADSVAEPFFSSRSGIEASEG